MYNLFLKGHLIYQCHINRIYLRLNTRIFHMQKIKIYSFFFLF